MPSSITLTVSHLPTSTSFFLSALQPLDYAYRGRCDNTIGFGSSKDPKSPADFWITQETPGVRAGAAHVAFNAPSSRAVGQFFSAALRAGGKFYADPAVRDGSGYYSAAVIDFDGNSIEAVYRPTFSDDKENDVKSVASYAKSKAYAPSSVSPGSSVIDRGSRAGRAPLLESSKTSPPIANVSGDVFDNLIADARNAANMAREVVQNARQTQPTVTNNGNGETIMGTILGVAAGAALHYAFTNNENNQRRPSQPERSNTEPPPTAYRDYRAPSRASHATRGITLEGDYASTVKPSRSGCSRRNSGSAINNSFDSWSGRRPLLDQGSSASKSSRRSGGAKMIEGPFPPPLAFTHVSSSSSRRAASRSDPLPRPSISSHHSNAGSDHTVIRTTEEVVQRVSSRPPSSGSKAHAPSSASKARAPPLTRTSTARKEPADYPLPPSRASTWTGASAVHSKASKRESAFDREVTPDDSISQISVGTVRKGRK